MANKVKWIAKGSIFKKTTVRGKDPSVAGKIDIPECDTDIRMRDGKTLFGEPVDARLAIHFIRELWKHIHDTKVFEWYKVTQLTSAGSKKNPRGKNQKPASKEIPIGGIAPAYNALVDLLKYSAGITVSRSMLLKTLSQPECCGIRFYLALKNRPQSELKKSKGKGNIPSKVFTLVMVGVDKEGNDLNFKYDPKKHTLVDIPNVENDSMSGEYPGTSGLITNDGPKLKNIKPYPLFHYAMFDKDSIGD